MSVRKCMRSKEIRDTTYEFARATTSMFLRYADRPSVFSAMSTHQPGFLSNEGFGSPKRSLSLRASLNLATCAMYGSFEEAYKGREYTKPTSEMSSTAVLMTSSSHLVTSYS